MTGSVDASALQGVVVFAGRLASMKRGEAHDLVAARGGTPRQEVSKHSTVVVVGELGWPLHANGRPANTLARAKSLGVPIVSEREFLEWAGLAVPDEEKRTYTSGQIAALSGLPGEVVEQLAHYGLIQVRSGHCGFRDLASARQIAALLKAGVGLSVISRSLRAIREWLPEAGPANLRLFPASSDAVVLAQLSGFTDKRGQFLLPVEKPRSDADRTFRDAQSAEEAKDYETAERLYRRVFRSDPEDSAAAFNLGNLLKQLGRKVEAEAYFRAAVKAEPALAEAWYNLADILDEQGRLRDAIDALEHALAAEPDYADAVFNLALLLQRCDRPAEAAIYWRRYLKLDRDSEWAARARRSLKYCEMLERGR